jgi:CheY-like chemotaxis protein
MTIVVISADKRPATRAKCEKLGADMFLEKPFDMPDLLKALRELRKPRPDWNR